MTRTLLPEWAYLVDETGRYWYHLGNGTRQAVEGEKGARPPGKTLFGIATNDLVSIPQWVSSIWDHQRSRRGGDLALRLPA